MGFRAARSPRFNNTLASLPSMPIAPTGVAGSATGGTVNLTWSVVGGITGYRIYRNSSSPVLIGSSSTTNFSETQVDGTYTYAVSAYNSAGESARSSWISVSIDTIPPAVPVTPSYSVSNFNVTLSWTAPAGGPVSYRIYRNSTLIATQSTLGYTDTVVGDGTYNYTVSAVDASGNWSAQSSPAVVVIDYSPPSIPVVSISNVGRNVTLTFNSASGDATLYGIMRNGNSLAVTPTSPYTDIVPSDGSFSYIVAARDSAGNWSAYSSPVSVVVDTDPPPVPVSTAEPGAYSALVTWNQTGDATGYQIRRNGTIIATVSTSTSYNDTSLPEGDYYYSVRSFDSVGNYSAWQTPYLVPVDAYTRATRPGLNRAPLTSTDDTIPAISLGRPPLEDTRKFV